MARVAIIKVFTGLNLAPAQLSAELQAAGHDTRIIYFKDFKAHTEDELAENPDYIVPEDAGWVTVSGRERRAWSTYASFKEEEFQHLFKVIEEFDADIIGMSVYSAIVPQSGLVAKRLKEKFPDKLIVWGGPAPTLSPEQCAEFSDVMCINEGEEFIVELADKFDAGEDISTTVGGIFKQPDGSLKNTGNRPLLDLEKIQMPDWDESRYIHISGDQLTKNSYPWNLMTTVQYAQKLSGKQYVVMTQRGCPFSCSFCIESRYQDMFGKKNSLRRRSVDAVIAELLHAKNVMKVVSVWFYDDVFTVNPKWLKEFLPRYKQEIGLPFWCYTYPTTHNLETLKMLKDAGCDSITMGVQSGSERMLKEAYNRPTKINRVLEAADEIVEAGLLGTIDLMTKSEFETLQDLEDTFQFMLNLNQNLRCWAFSEVSSYPSYSYSQKRNQIGVELLAKTMPSANDYDFYHKLYRLTRTKIPRQILADFPRDEHARVEQQAYLDQLLDRWHIGRNIKLETVDTNNSAKLSAEDAPTNPVGEEEAYQQQVEEGHLDTRGDDGRIKGLTF